MPNRIPEAGVGSLTVVTRQEELVKWTWLLTMCTVELLTP